MYFLDYRHVVLEVLDQETFALARMSMRHSMRLPPLGIEPGTSESHPLQETASASFQITGDNIDVPSRSFALLYFPERKPRPRGLFGVAQLGAIPGGFVNLKSSRISAYDDAKLLTSRED